jgi:hypothetical protein
MASVLYANYWQVLVSILYFSINNLFTHYHVCHEWSRYAIRRKFLRVTHPKGMQRSTYMISLPLRYGAPLMIASTILHVLISQSIFLINCKIYRYTTGDYEANPSHDKHGSFVTAGANCRSILICKWSNKSTY